MRCEDGNWRNAVMLLNVVILPDSSEVILQEKVLMLKSLHGHTRTRGSV